MAKVKIIDEVFSSIMEPGTVFESSDIRRIDLAKKI
jgi:hypothetical protein